MRLLHVLSLAALLLLPHQCAEPVARRDAALGDAVSLRCTISYHVETTWIKQPPDESPTVLLTAHIANDGKLSVNKQLSPRFTAQVLERSITLNVENVSTADRGLYYCLGRVGQNLQLGRGVSLTVSTAGATDKPPKADCKPGDRSGQKVSFYVYAAVQGFSLLCMIVAIVTVHLKTRRRP